MDRVVLVVVFLMAALLGHAQVEKYHWDNLLIGGGGSVTGIVGQPGVAGLFYVRTDVGDVYRWEEAEQRWYGLLGFIPWDPYRQDLRYGVESFAIDPADPDVLYVAAGSDAWPDHGKGEVLRSGDRGRTWKRTGLRLWMASNWSQRIGEGLLVDPLNSNIVYFASREGLFISTDKGITWHAHTGAPKGRDAATTNKTTSGTHWICADPSSGKSKNGTARVLYLGVSGEGTFRSDDGGQRWVRISGIEGRRAKVSSSGVLYVSDETGLFSYSEGVFRDISPVPAAYDALAIDPENAAHLVCATHKYAHTDNHIYRTADGGKSWRKVEVSFSDPVPWWKPAYLTSSYFDMAFYPKGGRKLWLTNWYGTLFTDDITSDTVVFETRVRGIEETVTIGGGASPPSGEVILYSGVADVGGFVHYSTETWPSCYRDNGTHPALSVMGVAFCEASPEYVVLVGRNHWNGPGLGAYSTDAGKSWKNFGSIPGDGGRVAVAAKRKRIMWLPQESVPYFSDDDGSTWKAVKGVPAGAMKGDRIFRSEQPLCADKVSASVFYVYNGTDGKFYRSVKGGAAFEHVSTLPLPLGHNMDFARITFQKVDTAPGMEGEVWVSLNDNGLYRSSDGGRHFVKITGVERAFNFSFGKNAPGRTNPSVFVYGIVNGINGIFRSDDLGKTWIRISTDEQKVGNDPRVMIGDRQIHGRVFIGTGGSGYFYGQPSE